MNENKYIFKLDLKMASDDRWREKLLGIEQLKG